MAELSEKLQLMNDTQIVFAFRDALVTLFPFLNALDIVEDDTSFYDGFDRLADALWDELVLESFRWKYGFSESLILPGYGFVGATQVRSNEIRVYEGSENRGRFVSFAGNRNFGVDLFNAVVIELDDGSSDEIPLSNVIEFKLNRKG